MDMNTCPGQPNSHNEPTNTLPRHARIVCVCMYAVGDIVEARCNKTKITRELNNTEHTSAIPHQALLAHGLPASTLRHTNNTPSTLPQHRRLRITLGIDATANIRPTRFCPSFVRHTTRLTPLQDTKLLLSQPHTHTNILLMLCPGTPRAGLGWMT